MEVEKKLKAYFDNQIKDIGLDVNVEEKVMARIEIPKRKIVYKKLIVIAAVVSMILVSTGLVFGAEIIKIFKDYDFKNEKGEVEWSIRKEEEDQPNKDLIDEVFDNLNLEEGKAVAIYVPKNNPSNSISCMQEPYTINVNNLLDSYSIGLLDVSIEKELLQKYQFKNGVVSYEILSFTEDREMIEEAKETGSEFVVKEIEVSTDISAISCDYFENGEVNDRADVTVFIVEWAGNEIFRFEDENEVLNSSESIMIAGSEVLYDYRVGFKQIMWLSEGCLFRIHSYNLDMTKEEMILLAEQIKTQY